MTSEAEKLASHLSLLRAEYVKLQQKCSRLERELAVASAQAGNTQEDSFVCRLLSLVAGLHTQGKVYLAQESNICKFTVTYLIFGHSSTFQTSENQKRSPASIIYVYGSARVLKSNHFSIKSNFK